MFEDDDLDDLYLGLDPSPDPKLQPHFLGSPFYNENAFKYLVRTRYWLIVLTWFLLYTNG